MSIIYFGLGEYFSFVYGLFSDATSTSDYVVSNDMAINKLIGKDVEDNGSSLI
jgi:hypothetical protein